MEIISRKEAKELGLKRYFTGKPCKHGHVAEMRASNLSCLECEHQSRQENKQKIKAYKAKYLEENKEKIAAWRAKYRKENKDKVAVWQAKYREENKDEIAVRTAKYRKENPIPFFIRGSLTRIFDNWKGGRTKLEALHGYTFEQLKQHLESQFQDGMTWDNRSEWHIDHIKPIKAFLDEGITDPAIINALDNLQPLWAKDNLSKGAKWES